MMIMMMMMTLVMAPDDVVMRVGSDVDRGKKLIQKKTTKKKTRETLDSWSQKPKIPSVITVGLGNCKPGFLGI